jgi:S-DNA-T family DNA segregation ATPase FtsK/SpoIIIE
VAADLGTRADLLTAAAKKGLAPDSKITADLAERVPGLRPHVILIDEAHRLFDAAEDDATRAEDLLTRIVRLGRAHGVILCLATQLGDADSVPPALLRMASVRMCLRVSDHVALNQLLGNGASKTLGVPADFTPGTGLVRTATGTTKIRSYYLDGRDLAEIASRALALREASGALTGDAAGDVVTVEQVDPTVLLRHVLDDMTSAAPSGPEDAGVAWLAELEAALTRRPEYAGRAAGWLTSELRARRVPTGAVNRRVPAPDGGTRQVNRAGVRGQDVRRALMRLLGDDEEEGAA